MNSPRRRTSLRLSSHLRRRDACLIEAAGTLRSALENSAPFLDKIKEGGSSSP